MARNQMWHYDVAVIGGGIAGLTAAAFVARAGKSVIVFEQAEHVGGRGVTQNVQGFHFNLGPHALYRAGHAVRVLRELGIIIPDGKVGTAGSKVVRNEQVYRFPAATLSLLSTRLFSIGAGMEAARVLTRLTRMETRPLDTTTVRDFIDAEVRSPIVKDFVEALIRVSTYCNDAQHLSAGAALQQIQTALQGGVSYLSGGWQTIIVMSRSEVFNQHRSLLMSIAYRMLGSHADAEDAVQETFLRWQNAPNEHLQTPKAYLSTIVTRLCIDQLRSARTRREVYVGPWLPEPMLTSGGDQAPSNVELAESLTMAFLVLLESLSPVERAAFLLHEVFDYDYKETAEIVGKTEANCRQMIHRAKKYISSRHHRFDPTREETERVTSEFIEATQNGDLSRLMKLFAPDAVLFSDGGGKVRAALNPIHGADAIARFVIGVIKKNVPRDAVHAPAEVNGQPAFVTWIAGQRASVTILDIREGLIRNLFIVVNPEKLSGVE